MVNLVFPCAVSFVWIPLTLWMCVGKEREREMGASQLCTMLHHGVDPDSAVSGNIHLHAERMIGMPQSILCAFNTFQSCENVPATQTHMHFLYKIYN